MRSAYPAVFLCALACASAPTTARLSTTGPTAPGTLLAASTAARSSGRGQFITGSFMTEYYAGETVYDALRRRAPIYLQARPNPTTMLRGADPIAVYIDGLYSGSLDVLQIIPAHSVLSVQRISAADAAVRFGPKHNSGALLVRMIPQ